jgi:hypothetical protein
MPVTPEVLQLQLAPEILQKAFDKANELIAVDLRSLVEKTDRLRKNVYSATVAWPKCPYCVAFTADMVRGKVSRGFGKYS